MALPKDRVNCPPSAKPLPVPSHACAACYSDQLNRELGGRELSVEIVEFGSWKIACDTVASRTAYAKRVQGAPEECGCDPCRNFAAAREVIYPPVVVSKLRELGVEPIREAEIYHNGRLKNGFHSYGGWFHIVGALLEGADAQRQIGENQWTFDLQRVNDRFEWGVTKELALVPPPFANLPLLQLEFAAEVPWIVGGEEPE